MGHRVTKIGAGARGAAALALAALLVACDEGPPAPTPPDRQEPRPAPASAASGPAAALPAQGPTTAPTGAPTGSAAASASSPEGTWEGSYDAKKGSVELPPKVKDKVRSKDSGKVATGRGTVTLTIEPEGDLRGNAKGALGDATIIGKAEGDVIRASVFPDDPRAEHAMTGILVGKLKDGVIQAELRVTGPDATLVRESAVELRRR